MVSSRIQCFKCTTQILMNVAYHYTAGSRVLGSFCVGSVSYGSNYERGLFLMTSTPGADECTDNRDGAWCI